MKSRTWMWTTVVYLFAALAMPVGMAAQDNPSQDHKQKHHQYKLIDLGTFGGPNSYLYSRLTRRKQPGDALRAGGNAGSDPPQSRIASVQVTISQLMPSSGGTVSWPTWVRFRAGTAATPCGSIERGDRWYLKIGGIDPAVRVPECVCPLEDGQIMDLGTFGGNESYGECGQ